MPVCKCLGIIPDHKVYHKCKKIYIYICEKTDKLGIFWYCKYCVKTYSTLVDSENHNLRFDFRMIQNFAFYYFHRNTFSNEYFLNNCGILEEEYVTLLSLSRR